MQMSEITNHTPAAAQNTLVFMFQLPICVWSEAQLWELLHESSSAGWYYISCISKQKHFKLYCNTCLISMTLSLINVISQHYCIPHNYWCCAVLEAMWVAITMSTTDLRSHACLQYTVQGMVNSEGETTQTCRMKGIFCSRWPQPLHNGR